MTIASEDVWDEHCLSKKHLKVGFGSSSYALVDRVIKGKIQENTDCFQAKDVGAFMDILMELDSHPRSDRFVLYQQPKCQWRSRQKRRVEFRREFFPLISSTIN